MILHETPDPSSADGMPHLIVVSGPTASGKSTLAEAIAAAFDGEIVNADSMQVYRKMAIGTAKPSPETMQRIPHHLFDVVDPDEEFTAADYRARGSDVIRSISAQGKTAVVAGGTGLYIRTLLAGLADVPGADTAARAEYNKLADTYGNQYLLERLRTVDPETAARIHPNNRVRIIRALEVFSQTGRSISAIQQEHKFTLQWCRYLKVGVDMARSDLYERINCRVEQMITAGLVAEVEALLSLGYSPRLKSLSAIGYKEICDYLAGRHTLPQAVELIKQNSRRYAKRQLTWFKNDPEMNWFAPPANLAEVFRRVAGFLKTGGPV